MSEVTATIERNGSVLPIVSPGVSRGKIGLTPGSTFTSQVIQGQAFYIFCKSLIHIAEGPVVTDADAPIDARGGLYLNANRGRQLSVRLLEGEDAATVWIHEVR
ncbi:hypothetical protein QUC26_17255 [Pseudomonas asiatica]|uniref:hypothetical protein n=1 Tax=Pseudomonas asiatica TaxID=2219225 RepID=UPI0025A00D0D|nr:hypothetical protein [Pseudomonas asiatica]MDM9589503.1 hypothetical protein [Pseudomonas asiatica]WJM51619.1 hypothetical protein QUC26_17255 [Pseudomonas asiatica]